MSENGRERHQCPVCHGRKTVLIDDDRDCKRCEGKGYVTGSICAGCGEHIPFDNPVGMFWDPFEKTFKLLHAHCSVPAQRNVVEDKADRLFLLLEEIEVLLCDKATKQPRIVTLSEISQLVKQRHEIMF